MRRRWAATAAVAGAILAAAGCGPIAGHPSGRAEAQPPTADGASVPPPTAGTPGRLSVSGSTIRQPDGQPIVLRGYNWGQWGTAQPQDAADNAAQGANSVRLPLRWWGDWKSSVDSRDDAAPGHIDPAHLARLDQTIGWATGRHLWVILFVDSNYGQGAGGSTDNFWTDPAMKQKFVEVWQFLVERYAHTPYLGAYEILPEPHAPGVSDAQVRDFYDSVIPVLRRIDPRTPFVVGPNRSYDLKRLAAAHTTVDPNIIYTGDYFIFDQPLNRIPDIASFVRQFDAPVYLNQVGIPSGKPDSEGKARSVLAALNAAGVGWSWWTYRIDGSNPGEHGIYYTDPHDKHKWIVKPEWLALVGGFLKPA